MQVRSITEVIQQLLDRANAQLLLELRESFHGKWEQWQDFGTATDALPVVHRESQGEVWETIARHLGLPEVSGGGYR